MSDIASHAPRRGLRWWAWLLIALGALMVIALPVLGIVAYVGHSLGETSPDQPFLVGPPQQPAAVAPLVCDHQCFELDAAESLAVTTAEVAQLRIKDERFGVGEFEPITVAEASAGMGDQWLEVGGDAACSFVPANAPFVAAGDGSASEDPIAWIQTWESGDEMMDLSARSFESTEAAAAFMLDMYGRVAACPWQDLDFPSAGGLDTSLVQITAQAAIEVPDDVAAVGWVREGNVGPRWRSYVWDLQRGNLVVQVRILTDGRILESEAAAFAEFVADRLGAIDPSTL